MTAPIILSPQQSQVYTFICANCEINERTPTVTEISTATDIATSSVSNCLTRLTTVGLLRSEYPKFGNIWLYYLLVPHASYTIRRRGYPGNGTLNEWEKALSYGY